jgi:SAM-dependent methyltransferase
MSGSESEMKQVPTLQSVDAAKDLPKELACRPCPVCCGNQKKVLYKQKFSGLSAGSFLHSYEVCVCAGCGMGFADRLPPADEFDRYYAEMSQWEFLDNQGVESPQDMQRFETVTGYLIEENLDRETSILDIGCATGGLLAAFKRKGYKRLLGLDPSSRCAELARKNYGIDVVTSTVGKLSELPGKFGLITLSGVLEHLYDPNPALAEIHRLLDEGGFFYVNVPDAV